MVIREFIRTASKKERKRKRCWKKSTTPKFVRSIFQKENDQLNMCYVLQALTSLVRKYSLKPREEINGEEGAPPSLIL